MKFDLFHSLGRIDSVQPRLADVEVFRQFFAQVKAAEDLGFGTVWVAESHFSSEVQKNGPEPVIPNYSGEVGLNADSMQLAQAMFARTDRIGFGTAILNIVGGNGGPIAAADRVRTLAWLNSLEDRPRELNIGIAAGRFPYINKPFGIVPRDETERILWPQYQQLIFIEAVEIFLRLSQGEILNSSAVTEQRITRALFRTEEAFRQAQERLEALGLNFCPVDGFSYRQRWSFDALKLVPELPPPAWLRYVLGSSDKLAQDHARRFADVDLFNLSFTPPEQINKTHAEWDKACKALGRTWTRARLPRTVLVFIDHDVETAKERASRCFDTYIEAMRGTAQTPDKATLMARALIGDSKTIRSQLSVDDPRSFHADDRLMLWFEFNQTDNGKILRQMQQFASDVMPHYADQRL